MIGYGLQRNIPNQARLGGGGAPRSPSLILKLSTLLSRLRMWEGSVALMSAEGRQGFWGGRASVVYHTILAAGPLRLQSDELINPQGITLCCPRQLHQGQTLCVKRGLGEEQLFLRLQQNFRTVQLTVKPFGVEAGAGQFWVVPRCWDE